MNPALIALAYEVGAPLVRRILTRKVGAKQAEMAEEVVGMIMSNVGVQRKEELEELVDGDPQVVMDAISRVEDDAPELLALYTQSLEGQYALLQSEQRDPLWYRAWRPLGMVLIMFFWLWQIVLLHVFNAVFKIALPPADWGALITLTSLYFGLYMGGHTVKDVMAKWMSRPGGAQ